MNLTKKVQIGCPKESHHKYVESIIYTIKKCPFPGIIVELGVATGRNTIIIGNTIKELNLKSVYYGFDTFTGYTQEDIDNKALEQIQKRGVWSIDEKTVITTIKNARLDNYCKLIPGDLKETLPKFLIDKTPQISLLYVDCNAYLPSISGMRAALPYMKKGGIICIDEHRIGGETKAIVEFSKEINKKLVETNDKIGIPRYIVI